MNKSHREILRHSVYGRERCINSSRQSLEERGVQDALHGNIQLLFLGEEPLSLGWP